MKRIFGALMVIGLCLSMAIVTYARDFSEEQRELYGQYVEIVESISKKYEADVTIVPMESFDFEEAQKPEYFKDTLEAIAQLTDPQQRYLNNVEYRMELPHTRAGNTYTKYAEVNAGARTISIKVTGDFVTVYNEKMDSQVFDSATFTTKANNTGYTWIPTTPIDAEIDSDTLRTYYVGQDGDIESGTTIWKNRSIQVEFYCSWIGQIS